MTKQVTIIIDSAAYEYSRKKWNEIAGIEPMSVTLRLSRGQGIPSIHICAIIKKLDDLLGGIDNFIPMTLTESGDGAQYRRNNALWHRHLQSIKNRLQKAKIPIYLSDAVNRILKEKKSPMRCTNLILTKCLYMMGEDSLTPKCIAETMIKYASTPWEKMPIPSRLQKVTFRVKNDKDKLKIRTTLNNPQKDVGEIKKKKKAPTMAEQVEKMILFPYSCRSILVDEQILGKIENDIKVLDDYSTWLASSKEYHLSSSYKATYESYRARLLTLPHSIHNTKSSIEVHAKETSFEIACRKLKMGQMMTEEDQLAMLKENKCPYCGKEIVMLTGVYGPYLGCSNHYNAGISNGRPYVNEKNKSGIIPKP